MKLRSKIWCAFIITICNTYFLLGVYVVMLLGTWMMINGVFE